MIKLENDWDTALADLFRSKEYQELEEFIVEEYKTKEIYPPKDEIYNALKMTSLKETRVVILGQDPYHGEGQANGLAFSVKEGVKVPPSLQNIYKEVSNSLGYAMSNNGDLTHWAKQGVLLLNTVLTVCAHQAGSHQNIGWEFVTDEIIRQINKKDIPVIFILWGNPSKKKIKLITNPIHHILTAPHPSPLSAYRGFFGCDHFKKVNTLLSARKEKEINWKNKLLK